MFKVQFKSAAKILLALGMTCQIATAQTLYTQTGTDPAWADIIKNKLIPIGVNSTAGILGSKIDVNNALVEKGPYAKLPIEGSIALHTVGNSNVPRGDFGKWTRWYQEDGNTEVFRLWKGEYNVRNTRPLAARIMAHGAWQKGAWHEWVGRFTFVKAGGGMIFQSFNTDNEWAFMLGWGGGSVSLNHRRGQPDVVLGTDMIGKSLDIRVRDNGTDYEIYSNGAKVGSGTYDRPTGNNGFYWGMYVGETEVTTDGILFVTGATIDPPSTPPVTYTISNTVSGQGTVATSPSATSFLSGTEVTLTATPATGWIFGGWSGGVTGTTNPVKVAMNGNKTIQAIFKQKSAGIEIGMGASQDGFELTRLSSAGNGRIFAWPRETSWRVHSSSGELLLAGTGTRIDLSGARQGVYFVAARNQITKVILPR